MSGNSSKTDLCGYAQTCCFTGPRPKNYPWGGGKEGEAEIAEKLKAAVQEAVGCGYRRFISGMAAGVDMLAAEIVLQMREAMPERQITLEAAVPFPGQSRRWRKEVQREYESILSRCDKVHFFAEAFSVAAYGARDRYMVERSSLVIAVRGKPNGGTERTICYARELNREIVLL